MKRILVPALFLGSAAIVLGWIAVRAPEPTERPKWAMGDEGPRVPLAIVGDLREGIVVRDLAVEGMCCDGCSRKLYEALLAVPGVEGAAVDFEGARAQAAVPADFDVARLEAALAFDKYSAHCVR